jgi:lipid-binding SYLF domain-containing protein
MKKWISLLVIAGLSGVALSARAADVGKDMQKLDNRLDSAQDTLQAIMHGKDTIPDAIARKAYCIAVVPGLVKGAFIFGAEYGQGVVTCRTAHGWSGPVFIRMAGGSWGFQAGGSGTDLVLVATNHKGFEDLLSDKFKIGAGAEAAAGPIGRSASASTDLSMRSELLTWSRSKGIFAGVDLSGVTVSQNAADTAELYNSVHPHDMILSGRVSAPKSAVPFLTTVGHYFGQARERAR